MFRYSLTTFLLAVALTALVVAGLASPDYLWLRITATSTIAVLATASIAAMASRQSSRWFWLGFAVIGWGYLALAFYDEGSKRPLLLTHTAVQRLDEVLETSTPYRSPKGEHYVVGEDVVFTVRGFRTTGSMSMEVAEQRGVLKHAYGEGRTPRTEYFIDIAHYDVALLLGCIGGMLALSCRRRNPAAELRQENRT